MLLIVHKNANKVISISKDDSMLSVSSGDLVKEFWRLAQQYQEELIIWVENEFVRDLNTAEFKKIFHHKLIMASYPIRSQFLPDLIGYIDQSPFIQTNSKVTYPTWRMSTDVGGIMGGTAMAFKDRLKKLDDFGYLINSIGKLGQQNSLFCYSSPLLIKNRSITVKKDNDINSRALFKFVYQFYKVEWVFVLFFCLIKYHGKIPVLSFVLSFFSEKYFNGEVDLGKIIVESNKVNITEEYTLDIIIPTLNRPEYLKQVLLDLKGQSLKPRRVIIVEQNPDPNSKSELVVILNMDWPFEIIHKFVHKTGACFARNLALREVRSKWIFFADDDIRIPNNTLKAAMAEIQRLGSHVLNLNCVQPNNKTLFHKIKQWGAFGSGTAIVSSEYALQCRFSEVYEFGFGEDTDFGIQLRSKGADVIYHPEIMITHLKAHRGGFREIPMMPWENSSLSPKPSPTMMLLVKNHFSTYMQRGYKVSLFIKFYKKQCIKNPIKYLNSMRRRWELSEEWAQKLSRGSVDI